jgi:arylsulfatase A-like enzyme
MLLWMLRQDRRGSRSGRSAALLAGFLAVVAAACAGDSDGPPPGAAGWDQVVVVLDTLRADALGCYGYRRDTSEYIDRFAAEGRRFEEAFSPASYTLTSVASLFTGLRPAAHRVLGLESNVLPAEVTVLPERLSAAGFATAAFSSNPHIIPPGGFARGFDTFEYHPRDRFDVHAIPERLLERVLKWWDGAQGSRRFLYVHVLPPHQPYDAPPPFNTRYGADRTPREEGMTDYLVALQQAGRGAEDPERLLRMRARYDAGLAHADHWFGQLMAELDARGARESAVVQLISDHGEAFGERGDILHGANAHAEMTHVPWIVRWPGLEPGVVLGPVSLRDLAATVAELADVGWPGESTGSSLVGAIRSGQHAGEAVLARAQGSRPLWALREPRWTLVMQPASGAVALFDRLEDPLERVDRTLEHLPRVQRMRDELERMVEQDRELGRRQATPGRHVGDRASLRDLGYLGDD